MICLDTWYIDYLKGVLGICVALILKYIWHSPYHFSLISYISIVLFTLLLCLKYLISLHSYGHHDLEVVLYTLSLIFFIDLSCHFILEYLSGTNIKHNNQWRNLENLYYSRVCHWRTYRIQVQVLIFLLVEFFEKLNVSFSFMLCFYTLSSLLQKCITSLF